MRFAGLLLFAALLAAPETTWSPMPRPSPTPTGPVYFGEPAVRMILESKPLGFDPDGNARWLVLSAFLDANGRRTRLMANSNFDWSSHDGYVQWQARMAYGQPSAIVSTNRDGPIALTVRSIEPSTFGSITVRTDTRRWRGPRVVARALGPYAVRIGWFPREAGATRIVRIDPGGKRRLLARLAGPNSSFEDTTVSPGRRYRYVVERREESAFETTPVTTPARPPATQLADASGKGMWLFFTDNPLDGIYFARYDPQAVVRQAVRAGLRYVELRTAYGADWEITPQAKPTIDAIIDGLAAHGIATIGWTVPRDTSFEDLAASIRTAYYRTAEGTPLRGVALDLERGDEFMGEAPQGPSALWEYVRTVRQALGRSYLILSTVEDPFFEHLSDAQYPYARIARYSSILQPMSYWRMLRPDASTATRVAALLRRSYQTLRADAGRNVPINIGGQTTAQEPANAPSPSEIIASLQTSRRLGAIGECFFAWDGTQPDQWNALSRYKW